MSKITRKYYWITTSGEVIECRTRKLAEALVAECGGYVQCYKKECP